MNSAAIKDVLAERQRQQEKEGWSLQHDDGHTDGELARAGAAYALKASGADRDGDYKARVLFYQNLPIFWPWDEDWWKPRNPRKSLVKAAALLIAEIERLDRATERVGT